MLRNTIIRFVLLFDLQTDIFSVISAKSYNIMILKIAKFDENWKFFEI